MSVRMALLLGGLCFTFQGCAPLGHSARTSLLQPLVYSHCLNDLADHHHYRKLAEAAWGEYSGKAAAGYSCDFERGFKEGFVDYLNLGGTGAPPPVPPRCYWNSKYETVEGHKAIQDWFAGFRTGAEVAKESGNRELVVLPASTCLPSSIPQTSPSPSSSQAPAPGGASSPESRSEEMLPAPRRAPAPDIPAAKSLPATEPNPPAGPNYLPQRTLPPQGETSGMAAPSMPVLPAAETIPAPQTSPTRQDADQLPRGPKDFEVPSRYEQAAEQLAR